MRVVVKMHWRCHADLQAWLDRSPGTVEDRRALIRVAINAMKAELVRSGGGIPTATYRDEPPPPSWWWRFTSDCWARFQIKVTGRWFRREKIISVIRLPAAPPV